MVKQRPTAHFSNRLEELALQLGSQLFKQGGDPFEKRIVLLPSHSLKLYLTSFFASHGEWSICAGISFKTLLSGAFEFFSDEDQLSFPSELALSFLIEEEIEQIVQKKDPLFSEVEAYLSPFSEAKKIWLSEELAKLFYEESVWEGGLFTWKGWKEAISKNVFSKVKCFSKALDAKREEGPISLHLFGFSHVPSHFYEFFSRLGMHVYFLSPSNCFWEDLCSDKERIFLEKKMEGKKVRLQVREQMSFFLKETHPLLANWGKVGRSLLRKLGNTESYLEELYIDPSFENPCILTYLQSDLLDLEPKKREVSLDDTSILCLSATSKLREVESLFETLQEYRMRYPDLEPKDILVLSCDLEFYFPYIQMVFGSANSSIGYSVHGISLQLIDENSRALTSFFSLAESRFEKAAVLEFFSFPSVMKKGGWSLEDVKKFEEWTQKSHILWGLDFDHKKESMEQNWPENAFKGPISKEGTWEEGISRLLKGLAIDLNCFTEELSSGDIPSIWPISLIEWGDAELLGKFLSTLYSLKEDLKRVFQKEKKEIKEWVFIVQKWLSTYFEMTSATEALSKDLENLQEELEGRLSIKMSFTSFKRAIFSHFQQKKESVQSSHLNTVKFVSMQLGASYPAEIVCILGCDESSFPRNKVESSLRGSKAGKEIPSITEQDRYLFLEMILHARKAFVCSYQRVSLKDQKHQGPSLLIQDLMNELDKSYFFAEASLKPSDQFTRHHPSIAFDQSYFQKQGFSSFSPLSSLSAASYYSEGKKEKEPFSCDLAVKGSSFIDIKKLHQFAKDPMKGYFKDSLGIFFNSIGSQEEEFFLSPLSRSILKKESFQKGLDCALLRAKAKGELPFGEIGNLAGEDLKEDLLKWEEHLSDFQVKAEDVFSLEFSLSASQIEKKGNNLVLPPISVKLKEGSISLVGSIDFVSSKGVLWFGKASKAYYPQILPFLLLLSCLPPQLGIESKVLFLETGKALGLRIQDPLAHLEKFVDLYLRSLKELCLIRPEWSLDFLSKNEEELEKKRESSLSFKGFVDPCEEWFFKRDPLVPIHELSLRWKEDWDAVFSPFHTASLEEK